MPIYEYTCRACGERFSKLQRMGSDAADIRCPACGGDDVRRELSGFSSAASSSSSAPSSGCGSGGFT
jgi:putative FmdB family regulatory protein